MSIGRDGEKHEKKWKLLAPFFGLSLISRRIFDIIYDVKQNDNTLRGTFEKKKLEGYYKAAFPVLDRVTGKVLNAIKGSLSLSAPPAFKARVKHFSSYYEKLLHPRAVPVDPGVMLLPSSLESLPLLTDILGFRVICAFMEDLQAVVDQIDRTFGVIELEQKGGSKKFSEFTYDSVHLLVRVPPAVLGEDGRFFSDPAGLVVEVQVRTILQDAWAEVEHELVYKSDFSPFDLPLRRKLASVNASLSLADIIFQELRDYQNKLNAEVGVRREGFYRQADLAIAETGSPLAAPPAVANGAPGANDPLARGAARVASPFTRGTIDDLLLEAIRAHNQGDFDGAVALDTRIIHFDPPPSAVALSVLHKHRGMAYMSQNKYREALADFSESLRHHEENQQSLYYSGIVHSLLKDDKKALECFTRSLAINPFHAHVQYRKALAHFKLGDYNDAQTALDEAVKLGFVNEDVQRLRAKLLEKFDMQV
jgi:ppGpp synthetase/RelA/SpoT-type nucleotidyltranferase